MRLFKQSIFNGNSKTGYQNKYKRMNKINATGNLLYKVLPVATHKSNNNYNTKMKSLRKIHLNEKNSVDSKYNMPEYQAARNIRLFKIQMKICLCKNIIFIGRYK